MTDEPDARRTVRSQLRQARAARAALGPDPVGDAARLAHLAPLLTGARTVAAYVAGPLEPPTASLLASLAHLTVLLPVLLDDDDLAWAPYDGTLVPGRRATLEPPGPTVPLAAADLVVAPALAVDRAGNRLGQGGGSYDRALPRRRPGVEVWAWLFDGEVLPALPRAEWDVPVTGAVTPSGLVAAE